MIVLISFSFRQFRIFSLWIHLFTVKQVIHLFNFGIFLWEMDATDDNTRTVMMIHSYIAKWAVTSLTSARLNLPNSGPLELNFNTKPNFSTILVFSNVTTGSGI